ncbi:hypothetical protein [Amycolatopsis sp. cmx-8-4]|uniref:hypothetical protein n=1 Tax=Amycolatopsis sp. cmx-8-4 TaxID=2790947 RepID=UPI00397CDFD8
MRKSAALVSTVMLAAGIGVLTAGPAAALGGETYGCQVSPGPVGSYTGNCHNSAKFHGPYSAGFAVGGAAAGTTYTWHVPAGYQTAPGLCTTTAGCRVDGLTGDDEVTVSVTLTQNGATETLSATAFILAVCGNVYC